jgi:hypothetical protein
MAGSGLNRLGFWPSFKPPSSSSRC